MTALRCPACAATFQGVDEVRCSMGHKPIMLAWWEVCECGHDSHYDMTTFCLTEGCDCREWTPGEHRRQITARSL